MGAIGVVIRVAVLQRLQRFETAARQIADGDLAQRVPAGGSDTISWLAREFNTMADSVTGLVGEVRHQRERLETVINSIDDGIVVLDAQRHVIAANDAFLQRRRTFARAGAGLPVPRADSWRLHCCRLSDPGLPGTAVRGRCGICERRTPEGKAVWEEVHASPILDSQGQLLHVVEVWRDISERRAAEAHLAESHRLASLGTLAIRIFARVEHAASHGADVRGRDLAGTSSDGTDTAWIRESASIAREQILRCRGITQHFLRCRAASGRQGEIVDLQPLIARGGATDRTDGAGAFGEDRSAAGAGRHACARG